MSVLNLSDFRFLPDRNGWGRPDSRGDGGVVVPFDAVPFGPFGAAPVSYTHLTLPTTPYV